MAIERKVSVRVEFGQGSNTLSPALERQKSQVQDLSRLTSAWQRQMEAVPNLPVGPWLKAQEMLKEQALRTPMGMGPRFDADKKAFADFESFAKGKVDPLMEALGKSQKPNLGLMGNRPPELTGAFLGQKKAADDFRQSIEELEKSLKKQAATAGMSANAARLWEIEKEGAKQGWARSKIDRLKSLQEEADEAINIAQGRREKGLFSPKRVFAGGGFASLGLLASSIPGASNFQQTVGSTMTGAGVAASMGGAAGGPAGIAIGSAIGGALGLMQGAVQAFLPTSAEFSRRMGEMADRIRTADESIARMRRGEAPGEAEISALPGTIRARVMGEGTLGEPGTEARRLERLRVERERFASGEGLRPAFSPAAMGSGVAFGAEPETLETYMTTLARRAEADLEIMDRILARGGAEGFTRPEIPTARGGGGIADIGVEFTRAILERSGPMERTADTLGRIETLVTSMREPLLLDRAGRIPAPPAMP